MSIETINQTNTIESEKTVEQILRENPELDESKYQEYLDIRLNSNQERQLLKQELDAEHLEEIKSNSISEQNNISQGYERAWEIVEEERRNSENNNENNIENLTSRLNEATQGAWQQVRERASQIRETVEKSEWISNVFSWLEQAKEKWWIMWFIAGIILWIASAFWYKKEANEKLQEARETVENALDPEQITETKNTVKDTINDSLWDYITPQNREILNRSIDWLSQEQINQLYHSIESWDFWIDDIQRIAPNIFTEILNEAQIEQIKQNIETTIIENLSQTIKEEYWIDVELNQEKKAELENLVRENLRLSDDRIMEIREIVEKEEFRYKDLSEIWWETIINGLSIMLWLISKWIVPVSNFTFSFVEASWRMIAVWAWALGINENITFENFQTHLEDMSDSERAMFIWMLYRKWWLFLWLVSSMMEHASRFTISSFTSTTVAGIDLASTSITNNFSRQAENIDKIAKTLNPSNLTDHKWVLNEAIRNLDKVRENYQIMNLIQKVDWNLDDASKLSQLKWLLSTNNIDIPSSTNSFDDLIRALWEKNNIATALNNRWSVLSSIGFWANADLNRLNRQLERISSAQKRMFNPNFLLNWFSRLRESINVAEVSRMWDRLAFHFDSPSQARDWLRRLNTLANRFPELLKWAIDKAPIIMVAWLAANDDRPFFESLKDEIWYLVPIVWPVMILSNSWWSWSDWFPKPIDPLNVWIWAALLTIDWALLWKEIYTWWARAWLWYILKPFRDVYAMWRWTIDMWYSISRTVARWNPSAMWNIIKEWARRVKNIPGWSRVRALALIWAVWYIWVNYLLEEWEQIEWIEELMVDWKLDQERVNQVAWELSDWQKEEALKVIIEEEGLEWLEVKVIANRLSITSRNPEVQSDWFIDSELFNLFKLDSDYRFIYEQA